MNEEILFRYFDRQLAEEEERSVLAWREKSSENQEDYDRVHLLYMDIKALGNLGKQDSRYDSKSAFDRLDIGQNSKSSSSNYLWRIAASVLVAMGLGWLIYVQNFAKQELILTSNEIIVTKELADGSSVSLNKNSQLTYPEKFVEGQREVSLKGEAYFEVTPDPEKPFIVTTQEVQIQVLGTSFNVEAYEEKDSVVVSVDEGIVAVLFEKSNVQVNAGEMAVFVRSTMHLTESTEITVGANSFWKTKRLSFEGSTLNEVIASVEEVYEVKIYLDTVKLGTCRISVDFEDESVENILEVISATLDLDLNIQGNKYFLSGKGCEY